MAPAPAPRFRIDPRAPPAAPPVAPPPVPAPTLPRATIAATRPKRRRAWLAWAAVIVVVLLAGAAVAVFAFGVGGFSYPKKYLVSDSETPRGLKLSEVPREATDEFDVTSNPGKLGPNGIQRLTLPDGTAPKEAWAQAFDTPQGGIRSLTVIAAKFSSSDDANNWVQVAGRLACRGGAGPVRLLQDGDVVVLVGARDRFDSIYMDKVVTTLKGKASGLHAVCSG